MRALRAKKLSRSIVWLSPLEFVRSLLEGQEFSYMSSSNGKVRTLIAAKERGVRDRIRQLVLAVGEHEVVGSATDGQEAVQLCVLLRPDIALINSDLPIFNGFEVAEMIGLSAPEVSIILIDSCKPDERVLRRAMSSGLRAYLPLDTLEAEVAVALDCLARIAKKRFTAEFQTATDPRQMPKVIVVTGGKGGIGKTTIATSLAICLAGKRPGKVVLLDLYTQFGDVATMLNISPQKCLSDLMQLTDEIDLEMIENYMVHHETGLRILVSATKAQALDAISVSDAENVIHTLKRAYTHIVVDLPPILHATTLYVLSHCYKMFLVTNLFDMPTVRDAKELYDILVPDYVPAENVAIIANRVSKYDRLALADLERIFGQKVFAQAPNDRRLVSAVNQGTSFMKAYSRSPLAEAIEKIADGLTREDSQTGG